jgi:LacI family transcriptional regulator
VLETLRGEGVGVPAAMSVVGIDDQPSLAFLGLTTVKLPIVEAGKQAIDLLIRRMANSDAEVRHMVLPCELIERGTSGPPSESLAGNAKRVRKTSRLDEPSRLRA